MGMSARGGGDDLNSEINVTPMVDVMLVLLIIFMVTAGMLNTGVELDLPQVSAQNLEDPQGPLVLTIEKSNAIRLGGTKVPWQELEVKLKTNEKVKQQGKLYIAADNDLPYGVVVTAMAVARNAGIEKVMMLTEPSDNLQPRLSELDQIPAP
ncbi:MAG: ExbD/TolR family protein [Kofleriaceae bacterium]